jgi:hypothetical protein
MAILTPPTLRTAGPLGGIRARRLSAYRDAADVSSIPIPSLFKKTFRLPVSIGKLEVGYRYIRCGGSIPPQKGGRFSRRGASIPPQARVHSPAKGDNFPARDCGRIGHQPRAWGPFLRKGGQFLRTHIRCGPIPLRGTIPPHAGVPPAGAWEGVNFTAGGRIGAESLGCRARVGNLGGRCRRRRRRRRYGGERLL